MVPVHIVIIALLSVASASPPQPSELEIKALLAGADVGTKSIPVVDNTQQEYDTAAGKVKLTLTLNPEHFVRQVPIETTQTALCILVERDDSTTSGVLEAVGQPCMIVDAGSKDASLSWSHDGLSLTFTLKQPSP